MIFSNILFFSSYISTTYIINIMSSFIYFVLALFLFFSPCFSLNIPVDLYLKSLISSYVGYRLLLNSSIKTLTSSSHILVLIGYRLESYFYCFQIYFEVMSLFIRFIHVLFHFCINHMIWDHCLLHPIYE